MVFLYLATRSWWHVRIASVLSVVLSPFMQLLIPSLDNFSSVLDVTWPECYIYSRFSLRWYCWDKKISIYPDNHYIQYKLKCNIRILFIPYTLLSMIMTILLGWENIDISRQSIYPVWTYMWPIEELYSPTILLGRENTNISRWLIYPLKT